MKAPYETKLMRVPMPLAEQVSELIDRYREFIATGGEPFDPPPLLYCSNLQPVREKRKKISSPSGWTEKYSPKRQAGRKQEFYYRYNWIEGKGKGRKIRHCHIPGGNKDSEAAQSNLQRVQAAMAEGKSPLEIKQMVESWKLPLTPNP